MIKLSSFFILLILLITSCTSQKNTNDFIKRASGRYLFNVNEVLEIYFKEEVMFVKWRGNNQISPLKINDSSFYVNELNEKIVFIKLPKPHIQLAPKKEHKGMKYHFKKMDKGDKTPGEYFADKEFEKALEAFQIIQQKDSLNPVIKEQNLNSMGYEYARQKEYDTAIEIFKINTILYPRSSNTFDSLAEAFLKKKDTANAIINLKSALAINPENRSYKKTLKKVTKK